MSKIKTRGQDIRCAVMVEGSVFINLAKAPSLPVELSMGSARATFVPSARTALDGYSFARRRALPTEGLGQKLRTDPPEQTPGEIAAAWDLNLTGRATGVRYGLWK